MKTTDIDPIALVESLDASSIRAKLDEVAKLQKALQHLLRVAVLREKAPISGASSESARPPAG
jgi:hypothetical protein